MRCHPLTAALLGSLCLTACHDHALRGAPPTAQTERATAAAPAENVPPGIARDAQPVEPVEPIAPVDPVAASAPIAPIASIAPTQSAEPPAAQRQSMAPPPPPRPAPSTKSLDKIAVNGSRLSSTPATAYAAAPVAAPNERIATERVNLETYDAHTDNPVQRVRDTPVSTFSIDVDTGSYANVRRMLRVGERPPADAVRAEEMINYFRYGHAAPTSLDTPFRVTTELAPAPWNGKRQLLMVGIKGYDVPKATLPPANLVFLIDTSGSMDEPDKLPLLKSAFRTLVAQLRPQDRVSIVVYAGSAGLVLPPTAGDQRHTILAALDRLEAGGSTNGGDGIRLAYATARQSFVKGGVNRVILATDGDFNVGTVEQDSLATYVADQRRSGVALSTLGFGSGNYNDAMAESLADVGDGNHAYIDSIDEARKVLSDELQSTLLTIARDVKIQIEFNPAQVAEYRLIGYENRALREEDFANDRVDAGDIGAGHEVTALYELTLVGSGAERLPTRRYGDSVATAVTASVSTDSRTVERITQADADADADADARSSTRGNASDNAVNAVTTSPAAAGELAHLRLRYKRPGSDRSELISTPITRAQLRARPSDALAFAATVAAYADALRGGTHLEQWQWKDIAASARRTASARPDPLRAEFAALVDRARQVADDADAALTQVAD